MKEILERIKGLNGGDSGGASTWFGVRYALLIRLAVAAVLFIAGLIVSSNEKVALVLMLLSFLIAGFDVILRAIVIAANDRRMGEEMLVVVTALLAFVINCGYEAAAIMIIYQAGFVLRAYAIGLTRGTLRERIDPYPSDVTVLRGEDSSSIPADEIQVNDILVIDAGERFPVDCEITMGTTVVDLTAVYGHEYQEELSEGKFVNAGAVNVTSEVRVRAVRELNDSTSSRAAEIASRGNELPSAAQSGIERYASLFAPFALGIGVIVALVLMIFTDISTEEAIHRALVVLLVSCPAALLASIPFTYLSGLFRTLYNGVLVKNAALLDSLSRIGAVVFDKDDLLSGNEYRVTAVKSDRLDPNVLLKVAAHAAVGSKSSKAVSIVNAYEGIIDNSMIQRFEEFEGGIAAVIDGVVITMGDRVAMNRLNVAVPEDQEDPLTVFMALNGRFAGIIQLASTVKANVSSSISALETTGADCIMLSSDAEENTHALASAAGIREYYSQCMPIDRLEKIQEIKERFPVNSVLYVGNGVTDNSSMDAADIGVCLNGAANPTSLQAGEIVVMDSVADALCDAVDTAKLTKKTARTSLIAMAGVKLLLMLLSVFGVTYQLWFAGMVDVLAGVAAILYSTYIWAEKH